MSRVLWNSRRLTVVIDGEVNVRTLDALLHGGHAPETAPEIVLDMSRVRLVKPAGVCHLICFLAWLSGRAGRAVPLSMVRPPEAVASYLTTLGFFSILRSVAGLLGSEDLIKLEWDRRIRRLDRSRTRPVRMQQTSQASRAVMLPIELIPQPSPKQTTGSFENDCLAFVNRAADTFEQVFEADCGVALGNIRQFWQANVELYKNVYQHSQSWGLATIVARPAQGAVVSYHDIGIGIPGSLSSSSGVQPNFGTDNEAITWALEEGHSCKKGNSGLGLSLVTSYVEAALGTIEIRSGSCRLHRAGATTQWFAEEVTPFAGTHISFHLPLAI